jgi:hypothetical protein
MAARNHASNIIPFRETTQFGLYAITNVFFEIYSLNATLIGCPYKGDDAYESDGSSEDDEVDQPPRKDARGQYMVSFFTYNDGFSNFRTHGDKIFYRIDEVAATYLSDQSDRSIARLHMQKASFMQSCISLNFPSRHVHSYEISDHRR